jgi:two-component system chemotaxis response regulator CheY
MRALIVDDSSFIREYVRQQMERLGWACDEACDGGEALDVLRRVDDFELMLVDVNMPVLNGLDCVKQLRDQALSPGMKVMMVTTEADNSFIAQALDNGADEFLMKPFSPQSLREKLVLLGFEDAVCSTVPVVDDVSPRRL